MRSYLEMAGHNVLEAQRRRRRSRSFEALHIDLAIVSANLPGNGEVLEPTRKKTSEAHIPVMGLADERGEISPEMAREI